MMIKKSRELTRHDRLSHLNFREAGKLLGPDGERVILQGGKFEIDLQAQVSLDPQHFRLKLPEATVTISLSDDARKRLKWNCSGCSVLCEHVGAAFSVILEDKTALGLAAPPSDSTPIEGLSDQELVCRAVEEREVRASTEKMILKSIRPKELWTNYTLTSAMSGKTYSLALRGWERGESFCSCPDFRKNTLGTCKHILYALRKLKPRFSPALRNRPYRRKGISLHIHYGEAMELRLLLPVGLGGEVGEILRPLSEGPIQNIPDLLNRLRKVEGLGQNVTIYPDAEEYIQQRLFQARIEKRVAEIRKDPKSHPLRSNLLKVELLPYQLDGIAFAVGAGRAVLADDMGLGKTIQGIGVAELLKQVADISKVLIICPTSLKSQWRSEIARFSQYDGKLVIGGAKDRARQYENGSFYTICNYEQVLRDFLAIDRIKWDLIVLDEGQRIKNWEAKTSRIVKGLKSPFALVLTGTPLENRLDDLYSVVEFIDDRRLGPAFRFYNRHRVVNERGRVLGYKNLAELRKNLQPILLRRTRGSVLQELPPRSTEIIRITPTAEQIELHEGHMRVVSSIVRKPYLSEMDLLRLQKALLMCRMSANSTYLVDKKEPGYSSKLEELDSLLDSLLSENGNKIVLFSEWTTMLNLIEPLIKKRKVPFVRLDGSVPQRERQRLVQEFQENPKCKLFVTSNAGSTGLNLQAANTVINVDLPWNPAVLEQRISRAHRMGQTRPIQVFVLVTEETIEESLLTTLSAKHALALAALDFESQTDQVDMISGIEELKRRLEILLGARPEAPLDESEKVKKESEAESFERQRRIAEAGGKLLHAAFSFLNEMIPQQGGTEESRQMAALIEKRLAECLGKDDKGNLRLTVTLPDPSFLGNLAGPLSRLLTTPSLSAVQ